MERGAMVKDILIGILTIAVLFLAFISSDIGSIFGKPELNFIIKDTITISTSYTGLCIQPYIEIYNSGKKPEKIGRIVAYLSSSTSAIRKVLTPRPWNFKAFVIFPNHIMFTECSLSEKSTEAQHEKYGLLSTEIGNYFHNKLISDPKYRNLGILPPQLYSKLCKIMEDNVKWIEHGEYKILINIYGGQENNILLFQKGYIFRLSQIMANGLKEVQREYYKVWPDLNPKQYFTFSCTPTLKEIKGNDLSSLIADFNKQPSIN